MSGESRVWPGRNTALLQHAQKRKRLAVTVSQHQTGDRERCKVKSRGKSGKKSNGKTLGELQIGTRSDTGHKSGKGW